MLPRILMLLAAVCGTYGVIDRFPHLGEGPGPTAVFAMSLAALVCAYPYLIARAIRDAQL